MIIIKNLMDEILDKFETKFHPLQELDFEHAEADKLKLLNRSNIKLLNYNIFLRPPPVKNNESDYKNERLADFIKQLENFDIVCLQEMFGSFNSRKHKIIKFAHKCGYFFSATPAAPSFFSPCIVDGGLLILSRYIKVDRYRFPIIESEFLPFKYCVLSDSLSEKGVLYAKIQIKDSFLHLFTTHFQASYFGSSESNWNLSIKARIDHMKELSIYINKIIKDKDVKDDESILLVGDFNVDFHNFEKMKKVNILADR